MCTAVQGWQGAHTLPREITFDAASNTLLMNPVHEAAALRAGLLANATGLSLPSNATTAGLLVRKGLCSIMHARLRTISTAKDAACSAHHPSHAQQDAVAHLRMQDLNMTASTSRGRQLEVLLSFAVDSGVPLNNATAVSFLADPQPAVNTSISPFTVGVQLDTGGGTYTRVHVNGTAAAAPDGSMTITQVVLLLDQRARTMQAWAWKPPPCRPLPLSSDKCYDWCTGWRVCGSHALWRPHQWLYRGGPHATAACRPADNVHHAAGVCGPFDH